jgi:hypothetical protein
MKGWTGSFVAARVAASLRVRYGFRSTFGRPLPRRPTRSFGLGRTAAGPLPSGLGEVPVVAVLRLSDRAEVAG